MPWVKWHTQECGLQGSRWIWKCSVSPLQRSPASNDNLPALSCTNAQPRPWKESNSTLCVCVCWSSLGSVHICIYTHIHIYIYIVMNPVWVILVGCLFCRMELGWVTSLWLRTYTCVGADACRFKQFPSVVMGLIFFPRAVFVPFS